MRYLFLLVIIFLGVNASAQRVKITKMSDDYFRHTNVEGFFYLNEAATDDMFEWIGDVRIEMDTIEYQTIKLIYDKLHEKGNKLGANAFRVIDSDIYSYGDQKYLELGIYHLRQIHRDKNLSLFQGPKIYLFGFLGQHKKLGGYKLQVGDRKILLEELRYKFIQPNTVNQLTIKLGGGLKKDKVNVTIEDQMLPRYYKFEVYKGLFSRSVISEHEWSFGELLIRILDKEVMTI